MIIILHTIFLIISANANIVYLNNDKQVELPSGEPVQGCSVPPLPIPNLYDAQAGVVNNTIIICGGDYIMETSLDVKYLSL